MECASEYQELVNHNSFIRDFVELGFHFDFIGGYFIIYGVPYLDGSGSLMYGDLVSPVDLKNQWVIDAPTSHQFWFRGEAPHGEDGKKLNIAIRDQPIQVVDGFVANISFSLKLLDENTKAMRPYTSFEEKVRTYIDVITRPAMSLHPDATPLKGIEVKAAEQGSPLKVPDTMSARYNINDVSDNLRGKKVAIIGLGGTGSYILDFIARTHLEKIAIYDSDIVHLHTLFRMPGSVSHRAIGEKKVDVLAQIYGNWHGGIDPIPERVTADNIEQLEEFDFVFVSVDDGPSRHYLLDWLSSKGIPFVDCGMGLNRVVDGLNGMVRVTGVDRSAYDRTVGTPYLPISNQQDDEYNKIPQIVEFNSLNASLAVIRFKQHFNLFGREVDYACHVFESATFEMESEKLSK